jgi:hypothetical protein
MGVRVAATAGRVEREARGGRGEAMGEAAIVPAVHDTNVILMW